MNVETHANEAARPSQGRDPPRGPGPSGRDGSGKEARLMRAVAGASAVAGAAPVLIDAGVFGDDFHGSDEDGGAGGGALPEGQRASGPAALIDAGEFGDDFYSSGGDGGTGGGGGHAELQPTHTAIPKSPGWSTTREIPSVIDAGDFGDDFYSSGDSGGAGGEGGSVRQHHELGGAVRGSGPPSAPAALIDAGEFGDDIYSSGGDGGGEGVAVGSTADGHAAREAAWGFTSRDLAAAVKVIGVLRRGGAQVFAEDDVLAATGLWKALRYPEEVRRSRACKRAEHQLARRRALAARRVRALAARAADRTALDSTGIRRQRIPAKHAAVAMLSHITTPTDDASPTAGAIAAVQQRLPPSTVVTQLAAQSSAATTIAGEYRVQPAKVTTTNEARIPDDIGNEWVDGAEGGVGTTPPVDDAAATGVPLGSGAGGAEVNCSEDTAVPDGPATHLHRSRRCYICKQPFNEVHHFYDALCPPCAAFNYQKRRARCDMRGKHVLLTGARIKIGFQIALRLLRDGATVHATTRFPRDALRRYEREGDYAAWRARLALYPLDLSDLAEVRGFCAHLTAALRRAGAGLHAVIHNAAQTIARPAAYYEHLLVGEVEADDDEGTLITAVSPASAVLADAVRPATDGNVAPAAAGRDCGHPVVNKNANDEGEHGSIAPMPRSASGGEAPQRLAMEVGAVVHDATHQTVDTTGEHADNLRVVHGISAAATASAAGCPAVSADAQGRATAWRTACRRHRRRAGGGLRDQAGLLGDGGPRKVAIVDDVGCRRVVVDAGRGCGDADGGGVLGCSADISDALHEACDLRSRNTWTAALADVPVDEAAAVHVVNALAPYVMNQMLFALLRGTAAVDGGGVFVVNVSAMEGQFNRAYKSVHHPHTNMAKASMNAMTRCLGPVWAAHGVWMTSVDTGWVTDEHAAPRRARRAAAGFSCPLDEVDGAARVLDPIYTGSDAHAVFLKDYLPVPW